jgi:UDP-2-acetamido-2,6-beta-L-arabino-hexul-4-ose reductase
MTLLVTGANGFIGRHLVEALCRRPDTTVLAYDLGVPERVLEQGLREADVIYHLAGVNRPQNVEEFQTGNAGFTESLCHRLLELRGIAASPPSALRPPTSVPFPLTSDLRPPTSVPFPLTSDLRPPTSVPFPLPLLVLSSSIQALQDNPYGRSKRQAELAVESYAQRAAQISDLRPLSSVLCPLSSAPHAVIFRLKNVLGKWCRPNYNSVTATFCHNIAHGLPIAISDPSRELELVYIDDVIAALVGLLDERSEVRSQKSEPLTSDLRPLPSAPVPLTSDLRPLPSALYLPIPRSFKITLGDLAARIQSFRDSRQTLVLPSLADDLTRCLYSTYLSYLDGPEFGYSLQQRTDDRGVLAEFMKFGPYGQIFVSRTKPGITRGNHYHHTKTEKFLVLEGEAIVRFRSIQPEIGEQKSEVRSQRSEDRSQRSEDRSQKSGLSQESSHVESLTSDPRPLSSAPCPLTSDLCFPVIAHRVSGKDFRVIDIPPGYTHSIENVGQTELVTLFWASEVFDPGKPDTFSCPVLG